MADRPPKRGRRFWKLAGMTASVATRHATTRVKGLFQNREEAEAALRRSYLDVGSRIAETLGELKGAAMKLGQMASMAADILPKELAAPLRTLQGRAPPMPYEVIAAQIERELGQAPEELFAWLDPEPFAAASIGQVHRARTHDGQEVVCKVQYPGVDEAVDSDLGQLRLALKATGVARMNRAALHDAFEELRTALHEELDYQHEAENVRRFARLSASSGYLLVPRVIDDRSTRRVLTLSYESGDSLAEARHYEQEVRDRIGHNLVHFIAQQLFELGLVHGDPNPANFAFRGDGTVVVYDFGCVRPVAPRIADACRDLVNAGLADDYDQIEDALVRMGVRDLDGPAPGEAFYRPWRDLLVRAFEREVVDFGATTVHRTAMELVPSAVKQMSSFKPSKDMIFINRMLVGHYANLRALEARIPLLDLARPYLAGPSTSAEERNAANVP